MKTCAHCSSPIEDKKRADARYCSRRCSGQVRQARYFASDPEHARAIWKKYQHSPHGTVTLLLNYARDRARKAGIPFDLPREYVAKILAEGVCQLSGLPLERASPGQYRTHPFAPSLDRVVPSDGYVESNVRIVAFAVNRARSDFGDEVLLKIARAIHFNNSTGDLQ